MTEFLAREPLSLPLFIVSIIGWVLAMIWLVRRVLREDPEQRPLPNTLDDPPI
jgi:hypothetical protein